MSEPAITFFRGAPFPAHAVGRVLRRSRWCLAFIGAVLGFAQDPPPRLGPGASKDEVIEAYGWPSGQSKLGAKEILTYPQGRVVLEDGRVEKIDFTMKPPWPPPRPRPGKAAPVIAKTPEPAPEAWLTRFDDAAREATRRNVPLLVLFTDPQSSPASRQFDDEVAQHPNFINAFKGDYVLLRLDTAAREPISAEVRAQHNQLREDLGIKAHPALRLVSPAGGLLGVVDLAKVKEGRDFQDGVIAAVNVVRDQLLRTVLEPRGGKAAPADAPPPATGGSLTISGRTVALMSSLFRAERVVGWALALGAAVTAVLFWLVWRKWAPAARVKPKIGMTMRISDAASGLPSQLDLVTWPQARLVALVAAFVEAEGYHAEMQPPGGDTDIVLRRSGSDRPQALILCAGSETGVVSLKQMREFFATLTAERVDTGWYVAPAGFALEAKSYATEHKIVLLDGPELSGQLRELPPLVLPKVLAKAAG